MISRRFERLRRPLCGFAVSGPLHGKELVQFRGSVMLPLVRLLAGARLDFGAS